MRPRSVATFTHTRCTFEALTRSKEVNYLKLVVADMMRDGQNQHDLFYKAFEYIGGVGCQLISKMRPRERTRVVPRGRFASCTA